MDFDQFPKTSCSLARRNNHHFKNGVPQWRRRTIGLIDSAAICQEFETMKSDLRLLDESGGSNEKVFSSFKPNQHRHTIAGNVETVQPKGYSPGQDSDVDSGIVACGKSSDRVGSASSTDTDSSNPEPKKTIDFRSLAHLDGTESKSIQFRTLKRNSNSSNASVIGPIKADHSVLKECNRRPPTPLTVFGDPQHTVRFDEQLQLSEQNIRRSCRKLFATLYSQRFSYPNNTSTVRSDPLSGDRNWSPDIIEGRRSSRSYTSSESDLRKQQERSKSADNGSTRKKENWKTCGRKAVTWNLHHPSSKLTRQPMSSSDFDLFKEESHSPRFHTVVPANKFLTSRKTDSFCSCSPSSFKASTDSGLGGCRPRCTCHHGTRGHGGSSSQSSTSSSASFSSTANHCCCCCGCCQTVPSANIPGTLFKSRSCSTIPGMLFQPAGTRTPTRLLTNVPTIHTAKLRPTSAALQKTSSCSSLLGSNTHITNVPVYQDNMMQVYAHVASVVPDNVPLRSSVTGVSKAISDNTYDTVKSPPVPVPDSIRSSYGDNSVYRTSNRSVVHAYDATKDCEISRNQEALDYSSNHQHAREGSRVSTPTSEVYVPFDSRLVPFRNRSPREHIYNTVVATVHPTSVVEPVRPSSAIPTGYLKPALKQNTSSNIKESGEKQNGSIVHPTGEVEYAVVDKTKKNRFSSLPALNGFSSSNIYIPDDEKDQPPVPPKKHLHKSDICLNHGTSSKRSFLEKMQTMTKSARNAFQRAFSMERIYRPEREERLEAAGEKLQRTRSLVNGIRASFSRKKKKKTKPPMAEVVPQSNYNPVWDDQPSGLNSPVQVRGQLLQLNLDGSQVVELTKPPNKPHGFFVARGRVRNSRGVFVSRMRDQETQKQLVGLLDIGDEILEIEGMNVKNADIFEVNNLMTNKNTILLTVLPSICRKDI